MVLLYITFIDFGKMESGSSVRPHRMYEAFETLGVEIKLLECQQNRRAERRQKVKEILEWLELNKPDLCYVEPPTGPFFNQIDLKLLEKLHLMGVPIGLFYRDSFWLFPKWWGVPFFKRKVLIYMHKRDLKVFKRCCSIVYFPGTLSAELFSNINFRKVGVLPPGSHLILEPNKSIQRTLIYIGGVRYADGVNDLLSALESINQTCVGVNLILVTKKNELDNLNQFDLSKPWLQIVEASGSQLEYWYKRADVGIVPRKRHFYMDKAVPVKLFEYFSHSLPVIVTDCPEVKKIVEKEKCGIICHDNAESLLDAIKAFYDSEENIITMKELARSAAIKNDWTERAKKVIKDLTGQEIEK